jgi:hypothetical protein
MRLHTALMWKVKPGTEQKVRELFASYGRPEMVIRDEQGAERGKLLSTLVFMKDNVVIRVADAEVDNIDMLARHLRKQPAIQDLEKKLDQYLEEPRDMSTPEGAQAFFKRAGMDCLVSRNYDD